MGGPDHREPDAAPLDRHHEDIRLGNRGDSLIRKMVDPALVVSR